VSPRIEPIGPDDWRRWRDVRVRALAEDPDAFACSAHLLGADAPEEQWRRALGDRTIHLAVDAGRDVGMIGLRPGAEPELVSMWVAPEARRAGVGRLLVDAVVEQARERPVVLRVMAGNDAAIAFYAGRGFVLTSREPDEEGALTMRRAAPAARGAWPRPAGRPRRPGAPPPGPTADQ